MTNYIAKFDPLKAALTQVPDLRIGQTRTVGKTGCEYISIQSAIDSITDANATSKPYTVEIHPGVYSENVTLKDGVSLVGILSSACIIAGKVTGTLTTVAAMYNLNVQYSPASDGDIVVAVSGGSFLLKNCSISLTGSGNYSCAGVKLTAGTGYTVADTTVSNRMTYSGITKDFVAWEFAGSGVYGIIAANVSDSVNAASGTRDMYLISGTGRYSQNSGIASHINSGSFSGEVHGIHVTNASTSLRLTDSMEFKFQGVNTLGVGTGKAYAAFMAHGSAEFSHVNLIAFMAGFSYHYLESTATGDTQKIWLASTNRDLPSANTGGLAIATPYVLMQTGFVQWSSVAGNYYSFVPATNTFTLLKRATGIYKSAPVVIPAGQSVVFPAQNATYFVYADSTGTLQYSATVDFESMILLFSVFNDGTYYAVSKQTHSAKFPSAVSLEWHEALGSSMTNDSGGLLQSVATVPTTTKTLKITGDTTYHDNGLDTIVKATSPINMKVFYTAVAGTAIYQDNITTIPAIYINGTTPTAISNNAYANFRVGVYPSNNLDDTTASTYAQYVIIPDTRQYTGGGAASAAAAAIAANSVAAFPTPVGGGLEAIMLGYVTMKGDGTIAGGTLTTITPAKQIFGANFAAGSSSSAGTVVTDTTNFDKILGAGDTSVQLALESIDDGASKKETGDIAVTSFSAANNQSSAADVTGLAFANASVRAFRASISIYVNATTPLYESVYLYAVQRASDWVLTASSVGDDSGFTFSITTLGQVQYTNLNYTGFTAATLKFRAYALPV